MELASGDAASSSSTKINPVAAITQRVEEAVVQLHALWKEIGTSEAEQGKALEALLGAVEQALNRQVHDVEEAKATLSIKLRVAGARIKGIQSQTRHSCGVALPAEDPCALQSSLQSQLERLEELEAAAEEHKRQRAEVVAGIAGELRSLLAEEHGALSEAQEKELRVDAEKDLRVDSDADLSQAREATLLAALAARKGERAAREAELGRLAEEMRGCWGVLGAGEGEEAADVRDEESADIDAQVLAANSEEEEERTPIPPSSAMNRSRSEQRGGGGADPDRALIGPDLVLAANNEEEERTPIPPSSAALERFASRRDALAAAREAREALVAEQHARLTRLFDRTSTDEEAIASHWAQRGGVRALFASSISANDALVLQLEAKLKAMLPALRMAAFALEAKLKEMLPALQLAALAALSSATARLLEAPEESRDPNGSNGSNVSKNGSKGSNGSSVSLAALEEVEASVRETESRVTEGGDPARLLDRGANSFRVRQQEEKRRRIVEKDIPKLTERMRKAVLEWEEQNGGGSFILAGRPLLEVMDEEKEKEEKEREEDKARRLEKRSRDLNGPLSPGAGGAAARGRAPAPGSATRPGSAKR
ncbi:hypothetical protein T484DRAFT_1893155, partial [Baffinella frigidus]